MSYTIIRVFEGEPLPTSAVVQRILATEDVPVGAGTNTRRLLTVLVTDGRFWMTDEEKRAEPLTATALAAVLPATESAQPEQAKDEL